MGTLKVTSEELESLSREIATGSDSIQQQLSRMHSAVQPLVGGDWEGAASTRFNELWEEWNRSAAGLKDSLDGISSLLRNAGQAYAQTEDQVRSSMG
jgi:WXG100 family type VII secretion target